MKIVILTGAGVSAESGLGTFRDAGGLWAEYDLEDVATPAGFARNPALVHAFYNARRANCRVAAPNAAHEALARLQANTDVETVIVTQNIDDLHERGGARDVIHMHGEVLRAFRGACGNRWNAPREMRETDHCPGCGIAATRPDVVWFGEMPYRIDEINGHLATCDLFVAIGTSGAVYPAAGFVAEVRRAGARALELNLEPSDVSGFFHQSRRGSATLLVPKWVDEVLGQPPMP